MCAMSGERARWWLGIALLVSVLGNLFLGGVVTGRLTVPFFHQAAPGALISRERLRQLPIAERQAFNAVMRRHGPEIKVARQKLRMARLAAVDAIAAPHYDLAVVEAKLADVRKA